MTEWDYAKFLGAVAGLAGIAAAISTLSKIYYGKLVAGKDTEIKLKDAEIAHVRAELARAEARLKNVEASPTADQLNLAKCATNSTRW